MEEEKKKLFGRGIYGSKDVPIRILDGLIVGMSLRNLRSQDMNLCAGREKRQKGSGRLSTIR